MRLILISFLFIFLSGKSQKDNIINKDDKAIINDVIQRKTSKDYVLGKGSLNLSLKKRLIQNIKFESGKHAEFGALRNVFSDKILKHVFNEKEFMFLISQLDNNFEWQQSYLKKIVVKNPSAKDMSLHLSKPIYTDDGIYSIIMFLRSSTSYQIGNGGILLYAYKKKKWELIGSFFDFMS